MRNIRKPRKKAVSSEFEDAILMSKELELTLTGKDCGLDERAPMYFVGTEENYSPMLFLVSTNDMPCRYEQTLVMMKLLEDFGHKDKAFLEVLEGKHCEHTCKFNEPGESVFANCIFKFIDAIS